MCMCVILVCMCVPVSGERRHAGQCEQGAGQRGQAGQTGGQSW